jgi:hypothetical protein
MMGLLTQGQYFDRALGVATAAGGVAASAALFFAPDTGLKDHLFRKRRACDLPAGEARIKF